MKLYDKDILYLDNQICVVIKPAGLLTQTDARENLQDILQQYLQKRLNKKTKVFCHPVHRLDKDVGGIVVFARTSKSLSRLQKAFRERTILEKIYYAKVEGRVSCPQTLTHYLSKKSHKTFVYDFPAEDRKKAVLSFTVVEKGNPCIVKIHLQTGRYHQIRAQMAHIGHPICGDRKYGAKKPQKSLDLYHAQISFAHPVTQENKVFFSRPCFLPS